MNKKRFTYKRQIGQYSEAGRFNDFLRILFRFCDAAGFHIQGRVTFVDKRTGKVWR